MKFVPTVTNNFDPAILEQYDEILLTPSRRTKTLLPENYKGTMLIDNGCFLINSMGRPKERVLKHIELCKGIGQEANCVFMLPDVPKDLLFTFKTIEHFLKEVKPKRYVVVDMFPGAREQIEQTFDITPEFYATYRKECKRIQEPEKYHIFGYVPEDESTKDFRSYDTFLKRRKYGKAV